MEFQTRLEERVMKKQVLFVMLCLVVVAAIAIAVPASGGQQREAKSVAGCVAVVGSEAVVGSAVAIHQPDVAGCDVRTAEVSTESIVAPKTATQDAHGTFVAGAGTAFPRESVTAVIDGRKITEMTIAAKTSDVAHGSRMIG